MSSLANNYLIILLYNMYVHICRENNYWKYRMFHVKHKKENIKWEELSQ